MTVPADADPSVDVRSGLIAGAAAVALLLAVAFFELRAISLAFGGLIALAAGLPGGSVRTRLVRIVAWLAAGVVVAALGGRFPDTAWVVTLTVVAVVAGSSLAVAIDARLGLASLVLGLFAILQPSLADPGGVPALLLGGAVAGALALLRPSTDGPAPAPGSGGPSYAVARAVVVGAAMWLGLALFDDYPAWAALTALIVLAPGASETLAAAGARLLGTLVGAAAGLLVVWLVGAPIGLAAVLVLAVGAQFAFRAYGYPVVVACITVAVVTGTALAGSDALSATGDRVLATALGAGLALVPMLVTRVRERA